MVLLALLAGKDEVDGRVSRLGEVMLCLRMAVGASIVVRNDLVVRRQPIVLRILRRRTVVARTGVCALLVAASEFDAVLRGISCEVLMLSRHRSRLWWVRRCVHLSLLAGWVVLNIALLPLLREFGQIQLHNIFQQILHLFLVLQFLLVYYVLAF